ncbi:MAG: transposase [Verrucomicrobia bacterium]|nr:transposase [Verrucomicrobiota bacterium]
MAKIKHYDEEFRRNAVDLLYSSRKPLSQVARELGVAAATPHAWRGKRPFTCRLRTAAMRPSRNRRKEVPPSLIRPESAHSICMRPCSFQVRPPSVLR